MVTIQELYELARINNIIDMLENSKIMLYFKGVIIWKYKLRKNYIFQHGYIIII